MDAVTGFCMNIAFASVDFGIYDVSFEVPVLLSGLPMGRMGLSITVWRASEIGSHVLKRTDPVLVDFEVSSLILFGMMRLYVCRVSCVRSWNRTTQK